MDEKLTLLNNIKKSRVELGLSQAQLAELVGVSRNTISSLELGQYSPTAKLALSLCIALEKDFEELFYFDGYEPQKKKVAAVDDVSSDEDDVDENYISDRMLNRMLGYLKDKEWSASEILDFLQYVTTR